MIRYNLVDRQTLAVLGSTKCQYTALRCAALQKKYNMSQALYKSTKLSIVIYMSCISIEEYMKIMLSCNSYITQCIILLHATCVFPFSVLLASTKPHVQVSFLHQPTARELCHTGLSYLILRSNDWQVSRRALRAFIEG